MTLVPRLQRTLWLLLVILPLGIPAVGQEKPAAEDAFDGAEAPVKRRLMTRFAADR